MQIYLTMPENLFEQPPALRKEFLHTLKAIFQTGMVSASLVGRHNLSEIDYISLVSEISPLARSYECALLLDNSPDLVRKLKVDGVHITAGQSEFAQAVNALKPDFIVGAGNINSRHEAMLRGEAGPDYLSFGSPGRAPDDKQLALAEWWAEIFEIPCLLFAPVTPLDHLVPVRCEFIGLGKNLWTANPGPAQALKTFAKSAGVS